MRMKLSWLLLNRYLSMAKQVVLFYCVSVHKYNDCWGENFMAERDEEAHSYFHSVKRRNVACTYAIPFFFFFFFFVRRNVITVDQNDSQPFTVICRDIRLMCQVQIRKGWWWSPLSVLSFRERVQTEHCTPLERGKCLSALVFIKLNLTTKWLSRSHFFFCVCAKQNVHGFAIYQTFYLLSIRF